MRDAQTQSLLVKAHTSSSTEIQRSAADYAERWQRAKLTVEQRHNEALKYAQTVKSMLEVP